MDPVLVTAEECVGIIADVSGRPMTVEAWRRAVSSKTKNNPAPDPVPQLFPSTKGGRPRRKWRAAEVIRWAANRPGRGGGVETAPVEGLWHAQQCADAAGISRSAWWEAVRVKTMTNPAPDPVDTDTDPRVPPEYKMWRYWEPEAVIDWIAHRPGPGNRFRPTTEEVEATLPPSRWTTRMCAEAAGVSQGTWATMTRNDPKAPQPIGTIGANHIYSAKAVRDYVATHRP